MKTKEEVKQDVVHRIEILQAELAYWRMLNKQKEYRVK